MKTVAFLAILGTASAFTSPAAFRPAATLQMADTEVSEEVAVETPAEEEEEEEFVSVETRLPKMSQSMPFMQRPVALTGELAGDVGFDPIGFAKSRDDLWNYREAEIKHSRLAMLAAAGWPLAEVFDRKIAGLVGLPAAVDINDRVPSILNGGLGKISPFYWVGCVAIAAVIDLYGISVSQKNEDGYFPGKLGFDPLGLYPQDAEGKKRMETCEITHGRTAMIAITAFAFQEFVSKIGVVNETPLFFFPIMETLHKITNSGYVQ